MPFLNTPGQLKQLSTVTPAQQNLIGQAGTGGLDLLKRLQGQQFNFEPIAQQARSQFQRETVPSIAERFSSMGTGGSQRSSAFSNSLASAGTGLEQSLAALRAQYGLQERGQNLDLLRQLLGVGLSPQFENYYEPGQQGWGTSILSALSQGLGFALPSLASGGLSNLGSLFGAQRAAASQPSYLGVGSQPQQSYLGGGYPQGQGFLNPNILNQTRLNSLTGGF